MPKSPAALINRQRRQKPQQIIPPLEEAPLPIIKGNGRIVHGQGMMPRWANQLTKALKKRFPARIQQH